jgi:hypothetical protein
VPGGGSGGDLVRRPGIFLSSFWPGSPDPAGLLIVFLLNFLLDLQHIAGLNLGFIDLFFLHLDFSCLHLHL